MAIGRRRRERGGIDAWPGYVDALSTLLMVIIFVLLVFVLAQGFLSVVLSSRDRALDRLNRQVAELGELLALERGRAEELRSALGRTGDELRAAAEARDAALRNLSLLREERDRLSAERDRTRGERDRLAARIADLEAAARGGAARVAELESRLAEALARTEAVGGDVARTARTLTEAQRQLAAERAALESLRRDLGAERAARETQAQALAAAEARGAALARELAAARAEAAALSRDLAAARQTLAAAQRDIAALREEAARLDRTVQADRATIEARLSDIASLAQQVRALEALRDQLERQAAQALARAAEEERARGAAESARAAAEALLAEASGRAAEADRQRAASDARAGEFARLSESARAQVALLTRQLEALREEIARLSAALDLAEAEGRDREATIAVLGQRLNAALAARVEELQSYRSDFFGRLRRVLGDRPEVRIVGDRFVFQSEVLFPVGSAELSAAGQQQIRDIGRVLIELSEQFPRDLAWVLRVDGHADRTPIRGRFASNWELSAARAIAVAQLLIAEGLAPNRVAAAAFGDTQPLDDRDVPEAYARNRRIELRLTDR
jgi:chemotaxis protein MotB